MLFLRMFHKLTLLVGLGEGNVERRLARVTTLLTGGEKRGEKGDETSAGKDILKLRVKGGVWEMKQEKSGYLNVHILHL